MRKEKINVLLVSPLPPPSGGIARWTEQYINWCEKHDLSVTLVNTSITGKRASNINKNRNIFDEIRRTRNILKEIRFYITKRDLFDIIHINTSLSTFGILRDLIITNKLFRYQIPIIIHYRCNIEDQIKKSRLKKIILEKMVKKAKLNIVLNDQSHLYLSNMTNKISKIPNFIDSLNSWPEKKIYSDLVKNVLFVGHVTQTKGIREILKASVELKDINFILVGPVDKKLKIKTTYENVYFKGEIANSDTKDFYINTDVFLFPTYTEGFSNSILEAMSYGLPIITTNVGANMETLEGRGGIIIEINSPNEIVDAILKINNKYIRNQMGMWNKSKVKENYSIEIVMEKIISMYKEVIKNV